MLRLECTKCSFLFCLGSCILICSVIYLSARTLTEPKPCFPKYCRPFFPNTTERWDCQTKSHLLEHIKNQSNLNCPQLVRNLHFITSPLSPQEKDYPLAFILTVHKELEVLFRLLRAIYAPQNVYCIHVDANASQEYRAAVEQLVACLPNVFLSNRSETVTYAGFSRLQADINCMTDLVNSSLAWRKVINLCGQDFPVKSNLELVLYMQSKEWRDRNMTPGIKQPPRMRHRTKHHVEFAGYVFRWIGSKEPAPHGLQIYFGTAYYALTRAFVKFVLDSQVARDLLEWSRDTYSPDEHYWVTLNHIKEAPGNHLDGGWEGNTRAIKWRDQEGTTHSGCNGRYVREICVYGLGDLPWIINNNPMFANKFESGTLLEALDCMELWHRDKVLQQSSIPIDPLWLLATPDNARSNITRDSSL